MRAVGQDMEVARAAGIRVEYTRIMSIIISTVLAGYGMIIYLHNIGTLNTYNSHMQIGMFSVAALLVGGATVASAKIRNVFLGVVLFHLMFIVSPMAENASSVRPSSANTSGSSFPTGSSPPVWCSMKSGRNGSGG